MESSTSGVITWEDFKSSLNSKDMKELLRQICTIPAVCRSLILRAHQELFKAIDLDISEAHCAARPQSFCLHLACSALHHVVHVKGKPCQGTGRRASNIRLGGKERSPGSRRGNAAKTTSSFLEKLPPDEPKDARSLLQIVCAAWSKAISTSCSQVRYSRYWIWMMMEHSMQA